MNHFPKLSLVIGGVSSGKSGFAEILTRAADLPKTYLATAQAHDTEMQTKIDRHKASRGSDWQTMETPLDIPSAIGGNLDKIVLVDCLSLWLTNILMADLDSNLHFEKLIQAITTAPHPLVFVSNEVGGGGVAENPLARQFQREQGVLNQMIAQQANLVVQVTVGLPRVLKGQMPAGLT